MKKALFMLLMISGILGSAFAEITVQNDATMFYSYGIADEEQILPDTFQAVYSEKKNGLYLNNTISMSGNFQNRYDYALKLSTTSRTGSNYLGLQLGNEAPDDVLDVSLDSIWTRLYLSKLYLPNLNIAGAESRINIKAGKFGSSALDTAISGFELESVQNMLKLPNTPSVALESQLLFPGSDQVFYGSRSSLSLDLVSGASFDESIQRLYDGNGSMGQAGQPVVGEYAPQLFARLALNNYMLPFGYVNAGAAYAYNGAALYTGNSIGASVALTSEVLPGKLHIPVGISFVYHEKNIDPLAGYTGISLGANTSGMRETLRFGYAAGAQLVQGAGLAGKPKTIGTLSVSGSYSSIAHLYRDTINLMNLGVDAQYYLLPSLYLGGGLILGTLNDFTWKTRDDVSSVNDDYFREYTLAENMGYEFYIGVDILSSLRFSVGYAHMKGLSMNHGLESIQSGMVKLRQNGSSVSDLLWETKGIYMLTKISL